MRQVKQKHKAIISSFIFLILVSLFISCSSFQLSGNKNVSEESDEYLVYSAVLKELYVKNDTKVLLINEQTSFLMKQFFISDDENPKRQNEEELISRIASSFSKVNENIIRDYVAKNSKPSTLKQNISLPIKYVLFDKTAFKSDDSYEPLEPLFQKYPQSRGYVNLSRVGFNKDRTEAFVSAELICSALCGGGDSVVLEKKNDVWKVKDIIDGWKS